MKISRKGKIDYPAWVIIPFAILSMLTWGWLGAIVYIILVAILTTERQSKSQLAWICAGVGGFGILAWLVTIGIMLQ